MPFVKGEVPLHGKGSNKLFLENVMFNAPVYKYTTVFLYCRCVNVVGALSLKTETCRVKYLSLKSIKLLSTTSGEISPTTNRIINLLFSTFKGIRDDLEFPLKEDLSSINLCALHCELRNTDKFGFVFVQSGFT